ncbi:MAG: hypothetical protein AAF401_13870 [Pseudomonadota bacterium]
MTAAAMLDPDAGRIAGFIAAEGGRPGRARFYLGGDIAHEVIALSPITSLSAQVLADIGPPPTAFCAFSARLPADLLTRADDGAELQVQSQNGEVLLTRQIASRAELARYVEGCVMSDSATLRIARFEAGVFSGQLRIAGGGSPPRVALCLKGAEIAEAMLRPESDGVFALSASLPASALGDGVAVVEFRIGDETLARYPISAGEALAGDLVAELASLRAELDQLKKTFRETMAGGVIARDERPMILAELLTHVDNLFEARDRVRRMDAIEGDLEEDDWDISE